MDVDQLPLKCANGGARYTDSQPSCIPMMCRQKQSLISTDDEGLIRNSPYLFIMTEVRAPLTFDAQENELTTSFEFYKSRTEHLVKDHCEYLQRLSNHWQRIRFII
jgi:hypothetical protein